MVNENIINRIKTSANDELLHGLNVTAEFADVVMYMTDTLIKEFPTNILTSEYLMLSLLDNRNTHANMILEQCLMSDNLSELRNIYIDVLEGHKKDFVALGEINCDDGLKNIVMKANEECRKMGNEKVGTEHILLSVLNQENNFSERMVLEKFSITYDFIKTRCMQNNNEPQQPSQPKNLRRVPLKSQVNVKMMSTFTSENINKYTINITEAVKNGDVDEIIGRDKEMKEIIKVLSRRKKNNVVIVGEGGVGKTAIVYGLAKMILDEKVPSAMMKKEVVMLNVMALISGTNLRGMFEERVNELFTELSNSDKYILLIDDIHTVLKGSRDKDSDISGMIGDVLAGGNVKIISTTTFKEYRNTIESNTSICRKLQKIVIEPSTREDSYSILNGIKDKYEEFHNVSYTDEAIHACVDLADRYITDRSLPDSAIDVMDLAGANTVLQAPEPEELRKQKDHLFDIQKQKDDFLNRGMFEEAEDISKEENAIKMVIADIQRSVNKGNKEQYIINENDIATVISEMTNIPISRLSSDDKQKLSQMDAKLKESVVGQDEAVDSVCRIIKRNKVGLGSAGKPLGTLLLLGPSGVGKTLVAKKLAEEVFGDENALVRIDMSEYSDKTSVTKLTGSNPGYVGYENGGLLTEAIKHKQYCVLLLDEIEKADDQVHNMFLQLFDEGRLTDSAGQTISFKNVIILMTSNVGAKSASEIGKGIGFTKDENETQKDVINKELKRKFTPEFLNRIDKIVYFNSLNDNNLKDIVKLELNKFKYRLYNINYNILYGDDVVTFLHAKSLEKKEYGARPIIRLVQENIEDKVTDLMLTKDYPKNYTFSASCVDGKIEIQ